MSEIHVGARVCVKKSRACTFIQPWRGRFEKNRMGTVVSGPSANVHGWLVEWDHGKVKYSDEWKTIMSSDDLLVVQPAP